MPSISSINLYFNHNDDRERVEKSVSAEMLKDRNSHCHPLTIFSHIHCTFIFGFKFPINLAAKTGVSFFQVQIASPFCIIRK